MSKIRYLKQNYFTYIDKLSREIVTIVYLEISLKTR